MADLRTMQPSFNGGVFSPSLAARVDLAKYATGLKRGKNVFVHAHGGVSNRQGLRLVGGGYAVPGGERVKDAIYPRLIPFQFNDEQSYILEFRGHNFRIWKNGGLILKNGAVYVVNTPYSMADAQYLSYAQEADVMYLVHPGYSPRKLSRFAEDHWTVVGVDFSPKIIPPSQITAAPLVNKGAARNYSYKVSAIDKESGEESLPSDQAQCANNLDIQGGINRITWAQHPNASRYRVYKFDSGAWGYIGGTAALGFDDENITPNTSDTPQEGRNPFIGNGNYPRVVNFIEQRLVFGATLNDPQAIWMSQTASYENMGVSQPAKASDAVTFRIKSREINEIRSLVALKGMMVLTSGAQWMVSGGGQSDAITPSSIKIDNQGYRGASPVRPLLIGNMVVFAQNRGGVVRDFSYSYESDGFVDRDLTIIARHLFEGREIKRWAYAQSPHSVIWVILDNGKLLSCTYMKEHDVWGWCEHESSGAIFEDVAVINEGGEDATYFVVCRINSGKTIVKWNIERLETRSFQKIEDAFFVDSGLSRKGATLIDEVWGLDHLTGEDVVGLVDGNVVRGLKVDNQGRVKLPFKGKVIHLGLGYESTIETLPLDLGSVQGLGTVQGRFKSVSQVTLRVDRTRGIWVGAKDGTRESGNLVEYKQRGTEAWNEATRLYTGDVEIVTPWDWNKTGSVVVKQFDPLPMSILGIMPDVTLGR